MPLVVVCKHYAVYVLYNTYILYCIILIGLLALWQISSSYMIQMIKDPMAFPTFDINYYALWDPQCWWMTPIALWVGV